MKDLYNTLKESIMDDDESNFGSKNATRWSPIIDKYIEVAKKAWRPRDEMYLNSDHGREIENLYKKFSELATDEMKLQLLDDIWDAALYNGETLLQDMARVIYRDMDEDEKFRPTFYYIANNKEI